MESATLRQSPCPVLDADAAVGGSPAVADGRRVVGGAVVDDDEMPVGEGLVNDRLYALFEVASRVVHRHHDVERSVS